MSTNKSSGNGIYIPRWLLPIIITVAIVAVSWGATVTARGQASLTREEASREYVTQERFERRADIIDGRFDRVDSKLDKLLARDH